MEEGLERGRYKHAILEVNFAVVCPAMGNHNPIKKQKQESGKSHSRWLPSLLSDFDFWCQKQRQALTAWKLEQSLG